MRAFVTGSAGFVGRHMVAALEDYGYEVLVADIADGYSGDCMEAFFDERHFPNHPVDDRYDLVVHAAARTPHRAAIDNAPASHLYNRMLDACLFEWAIRTKQRRVLYLSSCAVLDEHPDDYGLNKLAGEQMAAVARRAGLPVTVVRPYSGYGEDQTEDFPFGAFIGRARRREDPFEVWNGAAVRDWIHIDDVVAGALAVVESGTEEPVSLCTGVGTSMRDVVAMVCDRVGYSPKVVERADKPAGVNYRVGDPTALHRYYKPLVMLAVGVERALSCL